jgi:hypothetical protein
VVAEHPRQKLARHRERRGVARGERGGDAYLDGFLDLLEDVELGVVIVIVRGLGHVDVRDPLDVDRRRGR